MYVGFLLSQVEVTSVRLAPASASYTPCQVTSKNLQEEEERARSLGASSLRPWHARKVKPYNATAGNGRERTAGNL